MNNSIQNLWGEEFAIPDSSLTKKIIKKINNPKKVELSTEKALKSKGVPLEEKMKIIEADVHRILGRYAEDTEVIKDINQFSSYIDKAIENGFIAIDTETNNSLDPFTCKLMGACIYTPGKKNAYIPVNHVDQNNQKLAWQITESEIKEQFDRLKDTKIIMHNAKFDCEVIKCTCDCDLKVYWDTQLGARLLNENEPAKLKDQYQSKVDPTAEKYNIEHLFEGLPYEIFDPDLFALYAATDSYITYRLYEWQKKQFEKPENQRLYSVFMNIEMPVMEVAQWMEMTGVEVDIDYAKRLTEKYRRKEADIDTQLLTELDKIRDKISAWRLTAEATKKPPKYEKGTRNPKINAKTGLPEYGKSKNEQLEDPISLTSPTQLAILLYDVLKIPPVDKEKPRGTGEEILEKIDLPICKLILERRGIEKLIGTFTEAIPALVSPRDNRLHSHFNQLGTDTGRFSSTNPNLQQIPSHNKELRMMFKATDGYSMVGGDFSQQEPRLLASYANDENMIGAYKNGKDLYATVASKVYKNNYEDNLEHFADGTLNVEGKKRRGNCKSLLLGLLYGRGTASIAEQIHGTVEEAQKITDDFFDGFPGVKAWIDKTQADAHINGYVEDLWGRRRRLPDIQLPPYVITLTNPSSGEFNPLLGSKGGYNPKDKELIERYQKQAAECRGYKQFITLKALAEAEGVHIHSNTAFISRAERQCVNARVQGGAASISKRAMIAVYNDKLIRSLGFRLLICVHDELIGECPSENAEAVSKRLSELMIESAKPECVTPMSCDCEITSKWYEDEYSGMIKEELEKGQKSGLTYETAFQKICENHTESSPEFIKEMLTFE